MKKKNKNKYIIGFIILFIVGIIINFIEIDKDKTIFEKAIKDSFLIVQNIITYPFDLISAKEEDNTTILNDKIIELEDEINRLKEITELNTMLSDYTSINATIITRDLSTFDNSVTIDKGEVNGIKVNMAVITSDGLIGEVTSTSLYSSTVKLLTSSEVTISVKIKTDTDYAYGILRSYDGTSFIIEGISERTNIELNSSVVTTGMGDTFPSGISIGHVSNITTDNFDLAKIIEVESSNDFDSLKYVTVLERGLN